MRWIWRPWIAFSCFCASAVLVASAPGLAAEGDDREPGQRVSFRVDAERQVANDWVRAVVGTSQEDADPAQLADRINQTMAWALERARRAKGVKVQSGGYQTHPVHEGGKLRRWRASQEIVLETGEVEVLTALLGELQSRVQLRSFEFTVSDTRRRSVEEELVEEALGVFRQRAELVRRSLEARGYAIDQLSIDTGGHPPVRFQQERLMRAESSGVAPPAVEAGASRLVVAVHATIALE